MALHAYFMAFTYVYNCPFGLAGNCRAGQPGMNHLVGMVKTGELLLRSLNWGGFRSVWLRAHFRLVKEERE